MSSPPDCATVAFGRFRVLLDPGGDVIVTKLGILGRDRSETFRAWSVEQIDDALGWARIRRAHQRDEQLRQDAIDECAALECGLEHLLARERAKGGPL